MKDIFDDYMGVQYREGQQAKRNSKTLKDNPYHADSEMGCAWIAGYLDGTNHDEE